MNRFELIAWTDQILSRIPRCPQAPHYREDTFRRKLMLAHIREPKVDLPPVDPVDLYLVEQEWNAIFSQVQLTDRQAEVVAYRLEGKTFEEIGRMSGCSKQAILNVLRQACKKIEAFSNVNPMSGLAEVYRAETRRGLKLGPRGRIVR